MALISEIAVNDYIVNGEKMFLLLLGVLIFISYFLGNFNYSKRKRDELLIGSIIIVCFSVMMAWRPLEFPDTRGYNEIFQRINWKEYYGFDPFGEIFTVEYGFLYFMRFVKQIVNNVHIFYLSLNLLTCFLFMYGAKRVTEHVLNRRFNYLVVLAVYMSYFGMYYTGIAIRQGLSLSLSVCCIPLIKERKYIKVCILFILSFLIHRLAVVNIGVFFIFIFFNQDFGRKIYFIVWSICGLYLLFNTSTFIQEAFAGILSRILPLIHMESFMYYITDYMQDVFQISKLNIFLWLFVGLLTFYNNKGGNIKCLLNIVYAGLILSILLYTMKGSSRIYDYFTIYSVMIVGCAMSKIRMLNMKLTSLLINFSIFGVMTAKIFLMYIIVF